MTNQGLLNQQLNTALQKSELYYIGNEKRQIGYQNGNRFFYYVRKDTSSPSTIAIYDGSSPIPLNGNSWGTPVDCYIKNHQLYIKGVSEVVFSAQGRNINDVNPSKDTALNIYTTETNTRLLAKAIGDSNSVYIYPYVYIDNERTAKSVGDTRVDLTSFIPSNSGKHCLVAIYLNTNNTFSVVKSDEQHISVPLDLTDVQEIALKAPPRGIPSGIFRLYGGQSRVIEADKWNKYDFRYFMNNPEPRDNFSGYTEPSSGDDSGKGFGVGSRWLNNTLEHMYLCYRATSGQALWKRIDNSGGSSSTTTNAYPPLFIIGMLVNCDGTNVTIGTGHCRDDSNSLNIDVNSQITIDPATTGANGLDTGTLSSDTWYYVWVIAKTDGTVAGYMSTSSTPVLPTGYTVKRRVGWVRTDGSGNLYNQYATQSGVCRYIKWGTKSEEQIYTNENIPDAYTTLDLSSQMPSTSREIRLFVFTNQSSTSTQFIIRTEINGGNNRILVVLGVDRANATFDATTTSTQTIDIRGNSQDENLVLEPRGYYDDLAILS